MLTFSANLGFLWTDHPYPARIRAAAAAGFDAVELHYPYDDPAAEVRAALEETGLPVLSLNTRVTEAHPLGLAAVPGCEAEASDAIREAVDYAAAIGAGFVHVMAGRAQGAEAASAYRGTLAHAVVVAGVQGIEILIEPLNPTDAPGYFLSDPDTAATFSDQTGAKVMLDCYHMAMIGRDPVEVYRALGDRVGHVQFADVPGRGAPGTGDLDLARILREIREAGFAGPFGAEYRPGGTVEASLGWMAAFRA